MPSLRLSLTLVRQQRRRICQLLSRQYSSQWLGHQLHKPSQPAAIRLCRLEHSSLCLEAHHQHSSQVPEDLHQLAWEASLPCSEGRRLRHHPGRLEAPLQEWCSVVGPHPWRVARPLQATSRLDHRQEWPEGRHLVWWQGLLQAWWDQAWACHHRLSWRMWHRRHQCSSPWMHKHLQEDSLKYRCNQDKPSRECQRLRAPLRIRLLPRQHQLSLHQTMTILLPSWTTSDKRIRRNWVKFSLRTTEMMNSISNKQL